MKNSEDVVFRGLSVGTIEPSLFMQFLDSHDLADNSRQAMTQDVCKFIPFLHIADATAQQIKEHGLTTVGLLGTRFTMEDDFYKGRLVDRHLLEVVVPEDDQRQTVHQVIYNELCRGVIQSASRQKYARIMSDLVSQGAEAIILGCTEIGLLVGSEDCQVPVFDTTKIHAEAAVTFALTAK